MTMSKRSQTQEIIYYMISHKVQEEGKKNTGQWPSLKGRVGGARDASRVPVVFCFFTWVEVTLVFHHVKMY